jgi:murein DD-endopeptidase MepM/ murein hydrolase activator NlpD
MIRLLYAGFAVLVLMTETPTIKAQSFNLPDTVIADACLPLRHLRSTSGFGWRVHPITGKFQFHKGIDLAARHDTVFCILDGIVTTIGYNSYTGNYIIITHPGDVQSIYGHLSEIAVLPVEQVMAGQAIGITGATGRVTGEHLHFSIKYQGRELSPLAFLDGLFARPP